MDAVAAAGRIGIKASRAARFHNDSRGIEANYEAVSGIMKCVRSTDEFCMDYLDDVREDYEKRK